MVSRLGPRPGDPANVRLSSAKFRMKRDYSRRFARSAKFRIGCDGTRRFARSAKFRMGCDGTRRYGRNDGCAKRFRPGNVDPRVRFACARHRDGCTRHRDGCIRQVRIDVRGGKLPLHCRVAIPDASAVRGIVLPHARPPVHRVHWVHRVHCGRVRMSMGGLPVDGYGVVVVGAHHANLPAGPVEGAKEESR